MNLSHLLFEFGIVSSTDDNLLCWFCCHIQILPICSPREIFGFQNTLCANINTALASDQSCCLPSMTVVSPLVLSTVVNGLLFTIIVHNRFPGSQSIYNSWQHQRWDDGHAWLTTALVWRQCGIKICTYSVLKPKYLSRWAYGEGSECGNRISKANFPIVFHSNYGSILLSCRDMTLKKTINNAGVWLDVKSHCRIIIRNNNLAAVQTECHMSCQTYTNTYWCYWKLPSMKWCSWRHYIHYAKSFKLASCLHCTY